MKSEKDSHIISKILEQSTHLGDYIRQERKKRGLNQTDFDKPIGVSMRTIQTYEQGLVIPPYKVLDKIKTLLETNIASQSSVITINIRPCLKFKDVSWSEQYIKTFSEMGELAKELLDGDRTKAGYEAMDAITTLVNLMYNQLGFTEEEIAEIARSTNQKNHNRGYLEEVSNQ